MNNTEETLTNKESNQKQDNKQQENNLVLTEDHAREFEEYLLNIGVRI